LEIEGSFPFSRAGSDFDNTYKVTKLVSGAIGYLLKDVSAEERAQAIRAAHAGRATLSPEAAQALVEAANHPRGPAST
jgi:DNA-binding NarL/FixJ family response regulator